LSAVDATRPPAKASIAARVLRRSPHYNKDEARGLDSPPRQSGRAFGDLRRSRQPIGCDFIDEADLSQPFSIQSASQRHFAQQRLRQKPPKPLCA
jgi:hypothetical protein